MKTRTYIVWLTVTALLCVGQPVLSVEKVEKKKPTAPAQRPSTPSKPASPTGPARPNSPTTPATPPKKADPPKKKVDDFIDKNRNGIDDRKEKPTG